MVRVKWTENTSTNTGMDSIKMLCTNDDERHKLKAIKKYVKWKNREYMLKRFNCSSFFSFYFMSAVAFFSRQNIFSMLCLHWKCFTEKFHWEFTIKFVWKLIYVPKMFNFYAMVFARIFLDRNEFLAFTFFMLTFLPLFTQKYLCTVCFLFY